MQLLSPGESIALTVARAQIERGEEPSPNVAAVCVMALARICEQAEREEATP